MNSLFYVGQAKPVNHSVPQVLVVDDHRDSLALLVEVLDTMGCSCHVANSARVALQLAQRQQFSLALLDIVLPEMNGIDLLQQLRQEQQQDMIAIAVTALAFSRDKQRIQQAGFQDYLCKPYLLTDLEQMIYYYLNDQFPTLAACVLP